MKYQYIFFGIFFAGIVGGAIQHTLDPDLSKLRSQNILEFIDYPRGNPYYEEKKRIVNNSQLFSFTKIDEFQTKLSIFLEKVEKHKSIIMINDHEVMSEFKKQIPYTANEESLKTIVKNLPKSTEEEFFWIDIEKNNQEGKIIVSVYGRFQLFDSKINDALTHTVLLLKKEINGFQRFNDETIMKERTLRFFTHNKNWLNDEGTSFLSSISNSFKSQKAKDDEKWKRYINPIHTTFGSLNFVNIGTAFVIGKDEKKPIYYIATNKHVANGSPEIRVLDQTKYYDFKNYIEIGRTKDTKESVFISPTDSISHHSSKDKNLKGIVTFGIDTDQNDDKLLNTIIEKDKNIIKSIKIKNDFSNPYNKRIWYNQRNSQFFSLNSDFSKLTNYKKEKITLDMVVFEVEFFNEKDDPFKLWWSKRPTKIRGLKNQDFFSNSKKINNQQKRTHRDYEKLELETGLSIKNEYKTAGFPAYKNFCDQKKREKRLKNIKYATGYGDAYSVIFNQHYSSKTTQNANNGMILYDSEEQGQLGGSSGSAIFDKNLNVVGILHSGTRVEGGKECNPQGTKMFNVFHWLESDFSYEYLGAKKYKYINSKNAYSVKKTN